MLRYRLRSLLILLALLPPLLWIGWGKYQAWQAEHRPSFQGGPLILSGKVADQID